jgi:hypothetical protein
MGSIDGTIIHIAKPSTSRFIPAEFYCGRKGTYSLNTMLICDHRKRFMYVDSRWPGSTNDKGAVSRSLFLANLFVHRDPTLFPEPWMILADGGFHLRTCFLAPDVVSDDANRLLKKFNFCVSRGRCIIENAIGLLKMKWRRFYKHQIDEETEIIPDLVLAACVLHNICIDANDVNAEEANAVRDEEEAAEERAEIIAAYNRVLSHAHASMMINADQLVEAAKQKVRNIFTLWLDHRAGEVINLEDLRHVYGPAAFNFDENLVYEG